jgi:hypothetical protein
VYTMDAKRDVLGLTAEAIAEAPTATEIHALHLARTAKSRFGVSPSNAHCCCKREHPLWRVAWYRALLPQREKRYRTHAAARSAFQPT